VGIDDVDETRALEPLINMALVGALFGLKDTVNRKVMRCVNKLLLFRR